MFMEKNEKVFRKNPFLMHRELIFHGSLKMSFVVCRILLSHRLCPSFWFDSILAVEICQRERDKEY
uniref:Uncharacterized protein n=1 Tax=Anguilla anguilla TaxID=7936 RepID=A0A0E9RJS8_ANGAN